MANAPQTIVLAMTGASGIQYGLRLLECLVRAKKGIYLMMSKPAHVVMGMETDISISARPAEAQRFFVERYAASKDQIKVFGLEEWTAPVASGSGAPDAMVVCPCTTGTLSAIACGNCGNLIERAADVVLKERRQLIVMPREMPFSETHLENMLRLARMGAVIMPPNPGFYHRPTRLEDIIDFVVARALDHLGVKHDLVPRWGLEARC